MARFPIQAVGSSGGSHGAPMDEGLEANTQTFLAGAVLVASSGFLAEGGTNPAAIVGISTRDANNNSLNARLGYVPVLPAVEFEANLDQASALGTYVSAQTDAFAQYGITKDSNGIWYIDVDKTTTNARVVVIGFIDPVGTISGRVLCRFLESHTIFN